MMNAFKLIQFYNKDKIRKHKIVFRKSTSEDYLLASFDLKKKQQAIRGGLKWFYWFLTV